MPQLQTSWSQSMNPHYSFHSIWTSFVPIFNNLGFSTTRGALHFIFDNTYLKVQKVSLAGSNHGSNVTITAKSQSQLAGIAYMDLFFFRFHFIFR